MLVVFIQPSRKRRRVGIVDDESYAPNSSSSTRQFMIPGWVDFDFGGQITYICQAPVNTRPAAGRAIYIPGAS